MKMIRKEREERTTNREGEHRNREEGHHSQEGEGHPYQEEDHGPYQGVEHHNPEEEDHHILEEVPFLVEPFPYQEEEHHILEEEVRPFLEEVRLGLEEHREETTWVLHILVELPCLALLWAALQRAQVLQFLGLLLQDLLAFLRWESSLLFLLPFLLLAQPEPPELILRLHLLEGAAPQWRWKRPPLLSG